MFSDLSVATTQLQVLASLASILFVYGIYKICTFIYDEATSPVRNIPGPPSPSFIYGNLKELSGSNYLELQQNWIHQYGTTLQCKQMIGESRVITTDLKAINYLLFNNYDYPKPQYTSYVLHQLFGSGAFPMYINRWYIFFHPYCIKGVLSVEGDAHKHQRKILNPAFGLQQICELTEIFVEKALELRDIWSAEIVKHGGIGRIECLSWMSRTTLDIIGLAAFNYEFNALSSDPQKNELMRSFSTIFKAGTKPSIIPILKSMYPLLRFLPAPNDAERKSAIAVMNRIGSQLLKQSTPSQEDDNPIKPSSRRDILSLLIRANTNQDIPEEHRLKDEDMVSQIPSFLFAGHETTSTATSWALYALTQNKQVQTKLRQELSIVPTDNPTMDDLNGLPYLDAVVRETLRLYPPVHATIRAAGKDDSIPLSKSFMDKKGIVHTEIRVRKGQQIMIPIALINLDKSIWGEDSMEFKPERWADTPDAAASVPGVWANIMTFIGGPRACIGYRFSIVETKALLFTLIRAFEFDLAVPAKDIGAKGNGIQRPVLLTDPNNSNQMPLLVRPVSFNM